MYQWNRDKRYRNQGSKNPPGEKAKRVLITVGLPADFRVTIFVPHSPIGSFIYLSEDFAASHFLQSQESQPDPWNVIQWGKQL